MALTAEARAFAVQRHGDQLRKYSDEPYVVHLDAVVKLLKDHGIDDENTLAAALPTSTISSRTPPSPCKKSWSSSVMRLPSSSIG
jgi:(p)ppGpp synthase/HD superfamily hydrolase